MKEPNFNPFPNLETNRLILRQMNNDDKNEIFKLRANEEVSKYINRPIAKEIDEALQYINMINEGINRNDWVLWAITLKGTDALIGTICIWNFSKEQSKGEVGYELSPAYQGKGIMQEALTAVIKFGFESLQLQAIEGFVDPNNQNSIALLEKNHFIKKEEREKISDTGEVIISQIFELTNK